MMLTCIFIKLCVQIHKSVQKYKHLNLHIGHMHSINCCLRQFVTSDFYLIDELGNSKDYNFTIAGTYTASALICSSIIYYVLHAQPMPEITRIM